MAIDALGRRGVHQAGWRALLLTLAFLLPAGLVLGFTLISIPGINFSTSESESAPNGVTPDSGPSGTEFTFLLDYRDIAARGIPGTAPGVSQLHIDLNGDAFVGTGRLAPAIVPPDQRPGYWLLAGLLLALLGTLLYRHHRRWRPAIQQSAIAISLSVWLFACSFGDDSASAKHGGLALAECTSPASEVIDMSRVSTGAADYYTPPGEEFASTVTLDCSAGVVLFRFYYELSDGTEVTFGNAQGHHYLIIE